ncbi:MAG: Ig-like domain-containing protein, partial [Terriglobales bacterium]
MALNKAYRSIASIALGWFIGSCGESPTAPPPPTTDVVTISSATTSLVPAETVQLSATAKDRAGQALQRVFTWTSSDPAKATVSSSGMVAGVSPGSATVTAAVDGKSATSSITVLDGGMVSVSGTTLNLASGTVQIAVPSDALSGTKSLFVAPSTASATDPRVVKGTAFDFGPSGTSFAKPVSLKIKYDPANLPPGTEEQALQIHLSGSSGWQVIDGSMADTSAKVVTAEVSHFSTYAILTPPTVAVVTIRGPPEKPVQENAVSLVVGETVQLTATLTDADGHVLSNRAITWASSDAGTASVTSSGLVTAVKPGPAKISASAGGVTSSITVTVTPVPVASVAVTLTPPTITVGQTSQAAAVLK